MTNKSEIPTFSHITERDVDFLLVEEIRCSHAFQQWLWTQAVKEMEKIPKFPFQPVEVLHSYSSEIQGLGETDIQVTFGTSKTQETEIYRFLIENKIDAAFQQNQPQRYRQRAEQISQEDENVRAATILMAPNEYLESKSDCAWFDVTISYESIQDYFIARGGEETEGARRAQHKNEILEQAIEKYRRGYSPDISTEVTDFWRQYYLDCLEFAPSLKLEDPGKKPVGAGFIAFLNSLERVSGLPRCVIKHKLPHGRVDLEMSGRAMHFEQMSPAVEPHLEEGMGTRRASKSFAITIDVPLLETTKPFADQREAASKGMAAAVALQRWFEKNKTQLVEIVRDIEGKSGL